MSELKILIHIGNHLNVVNLLGACTKPNGTELGRPGGREKLLGALVCGGEGWADLGEGGGGPGRRVTGEQRRCFGVGPPACPRSHRARLLPCPRTPHGDCGVLQVRQPLQLLARQAGGLQPLRGRWAPSQGQSSTVSWPPKWAGGMPLSWAAEPPSDLLCAPAGEIP